MELEIQTLGQEGQMRGWGCRPGGGWASGDSVPWRAQRCPDPAKVGMTVFWTEGVGKMQPQTPRTLETAVKYPKIALPTLLSERACLYSSSSCPQAFGAQLIYSTNNFSSGGRPTKLNHWLATCDSGKSLDQPKSVFSSAKWDIYKIL